MCEEHKCKLVGYDSLPEYLKDNNFILDYYRCEWPLKDTIFSIFTIHNETLNVWTHLIGFFIFLVLTVFTAMVIPRENSLPSTCLASPIPGNELHNSTFCAEEVQKQLSVWKYPQLIINCLPKRFSELNSNLIKPWVLTSVKDDVTNMISTLLAKPITRWPFFAFLGGAMFCLLTSSICHLISCHSKQMAYTMLRLDYTGISVLIVTSFYPLVYYSFLCDPFFSNLYLGFITTFGVATVLVSLVPMFQNPDLRMVRASLFCCMGVSGLVPICHKLIVFNDRPEAILSTWYEVLMGIFYGLGVVVYVTRIPERWMPGKFDLVGNSHQLFHLLVIAGAYTHYLTGLVYLKWRDSEGCSN